MAHRKCGGRQAGFTLIEMLLTAGVLTVIAAMAIPLYLSLSKRNDLDAAVTVLAQDLYQAQNASRAQERDSGWGVAVNGQVITLFSGTSYATRNSNYDVNYTVPANISLSGGPQIVYSKLYGLPTSTGTFNLTSAGQTKTVTVNSKGMVEY